ncbi:hypothetical protein BGZ60DRAFT_406620 [Tricladium varicosporioides]|nr:hypothetical protein BGZ60DRAFT_406620 [Hymenoscyphus varicosporioides]
MLFFFLLKATFIITIAAASSIPENLSTPPNSFALRLSSPSEPLIDGAFLQPGSTNDARLFASPSSPSISTAWAFMSTPNLLTISNNSSIELTNITSQLIILGRKFYMWDPEPAMLQMVVEPLANAKTGFLGSAWPSVYISAVWGFPVFVREEGYGQLKKRWLGFKFDHGSWRAQKDTLYPNNDHWTVFWWNGTANAEVAVDNVPVGIEIVPVL